MVIGIDCTGSCKSNYHAIMTMMAPFVQTMLERLYHWSDKQHYMTSDNVFSDRLTSLVMFCDKTRGEYNIYSPGVVTFNEVDTRIY